MKKPRKKGRPKKPDDRKKVKVYATVSPLAYRNYLKIPAGEASERISRFLERINPELEVKTKPGERIENITEGNENEKTNEEKIETSN